MDTRTHWFHLCDSGPGTTSWEVWVGCDDHCKKLEHSSVVSFLFWFERLMCHLYYSIFIIQRFIWIISESCDTWILIILIFISHVWVCVIICLLTSHNALRFRAGETCKKGKWADVVYWAIHMSAFDRSFLVIMTAVEWISFGELPCCPSLRC